jgi:hypothetical protein
MAKLIWGIQIGIAQSPCEADQFKAAPVGHRELFQHQRDPHEIAMLEGMGHRHEGRGRAQPRHHVGDGTGLKAELPPQGLDNHQDADQRDTARAQCASHQVGAVERAPQRMRRRHRGGGDALHGDGHIGGQRHGTLTSGSRRR